MYILYYILLQFILQLEAKDNIPNNICSSCLTTIINFHNLLLQFQETEKFLKNIYESAKIDPPTAKIEDYDENNYDDIETKSEKGLIEVVEDNVAERDLQLNSNGNLNNTDDSNLHEELFLQNEMQCQPENKINTDDTIVRCDSLESEKIIGETETEIVIESLKYSCEKCGDSFLYRLSFKLHLLQKHNIHLEEPEVVKHSSKIIIKQPKVSLDLIAISKKVPSTIQQPMQCKICKEYFENKSKLKEHLNIHKTHICPVCGLAFLKKCYLRDHLVVHSSERNFVCNICNAAFKHRHGLTAHKTFHKTLRDYTCETCGHSFKDNGTLKVHIKLKHSDERNYACSQCPLKFKLKSFLDKHFIRKHTERTKDFMCSDCGVAYLNRTTLLRHISQKHSGKDPEHQCPVCSKCFKVKLSLKKHLISIHKICTFK